MEKVKLTQEQADWLARYELTQLQIDHYIDIQLLNKRPDSPIVDWSASKLARALYIGYEIDTTLEKTRRWWGKHNREVWELRKGDILVSHNDTIARVYDPVTEPQALSDIKNKYKIMCFVERRLDI